jgi:hypothetical protein
MNKNQDLHNFTFNECKSLYNGGNTYIVLNRNFCNNFLSSPQAKLYVSSAGLLKHSSIKYLALLALSGTVVIPILSFMSVITTTAWLGLVSLVLGIYLSSTTQKIACDIIREEMVTNESLFNMVTLSTLNTNDFICRLVDSSARH